MTHQSDVSHTEVRHEMANRLSGRVEFMAPSKPVPWGRIGRTCNETHTCSAPERRMPMRLDAERISRIKERLKTSDWSLLEDLERLKLATAGQLRRLHWPERAAARTARRHLKWLADQRVVMRLDRRVGGARAGSDGHIYLLDVVGQRLLGAKSARRPHEPGWSFLRHQLSVSELYVRCREAERQAQLTLIDFAAEPASWRQHGQGVLKPDAAVVMTTADFEYHAFIEIDCGTEAASTISAKAEAYDRYYRTGLEQARVSVFPQIAWLVPNERRRNQLVDILSRRRPESWRLHRVLPMNEAPLGLIN